MIPSFLPSLPGRRRDAHLRIKSPPVYAKSPSIWETDTPSVKASFLGRQRFRKGSVSEMPSGRRADGGAAAHADTRVKIGTLRSLPELETRVRRDREETSPRSSPELKGHATGHTPSCSSSCAHRCRRAFRTFTGHLFGFHSNSKRKSQRLVSN